MLGWLNQGVWDDWDIGKLIKWLVGKHEWKRLFGTYI